MDELQPGAVVYLRGDVEMGTAMTVVAESHTAGHVEVVWLCREGLMQETRLPRAAVLTPVEASAEAFARLERERGASLRKPFTGPEW